MRQMIFYLMTDAETFDPAISTRSLADLKAEGFDSIYFEYRNTLAPHSSPRFRAAVKHVCGSAARSCSISLYVNDPIGSDESEQADRILSGLLDAWIRGEAVALQRLASVQRRLEQPQRVQLASSHHDYAKYFERLEL